MITRIKVRRVYHLQMQFEKARLDDALAQMQAIVAAQAKNVSQTPFKTPENASPARIKQTAQNLVPSFKSAVDYA